MNILDQNFTLLDDGVTAEPVKRHLTGMYLFDRAFENHLGEIGMPLGAGYEFRGNTGVGKTTLAYSLMGLLGKQLNTDVSLWSTEELNLSALESMLSFQQYSGNAHIISTGSDEEMVERWIDTLNPPKKSKYESVGVAVLDSIAAISSHREQEGDTGQGYNMGRAVIMSQMQKKILPLMAGRNPGSEKVVLYTNHWYQGSSGWYSPGGNVKEFLCRVQVLLKVKERYNDGQLVEGEVKKNSYGYKGRKFYLFLRYGYGLHTGITALFDGLLLGKIQKTTVVKIGDVSYGSLNKIISEKFDDPEFFIPFQEALNEQN